jgi:hypothetical protein
MSHIGPFLCINKMSELTITNTLYTVNFHAHICEAQRYAIAIAMQTTEAAVAFSAAGRRYADGLIKFEPRDLEAVQLRVTLNKQSVISTYRQVAAALIRGDTKIARSLSDKWSSRRTNIVLDAA